MPLNSNYANGTYYNEKWFCGCPEELTWKTSGKEGSKGERFVSCPTRECNFFLAEKDDSSARIKQASITVPVPRTPGKQTSNAASAFPTPETGSRVTRNLFGTSSRGGAGTTPGTTPLAHRFNNSEEGDLATIVFDLLLEANVDLKNSTRNKIRHVIRERIVAYEAKLRNSTESLEDALKSLRELEK